MAARYISELSTPRVLVATRRPKASRYRDDKLNLVKRIIPVPGDTFLVVGDGRLCTVQPSGVPATCVDWPIELWELDVLVDSSGMRTTIVGSGGWGKPSVAVLDLKGALKWKFDGWGFDLMDDAFVAESADRGVVVVGNRTFALADRRPFSTFRVFVGQWDRRTSTRISNAIPLQARENLLRLVNGDGQELHKAQVGIGAWHEPLVVQGPEPFVVLSSSEELAIYDRELKERRRFRRQVHSFRYTLRLLPFSALGWTARLLFSSRAGEAGAGDLYSLYRRRRSHLPGNSRQRFPERQAVQRCRWRSHVPGRRPRRSLVLPLRTMTSGCSSRPHRALRVLCG